LCTAENFSTVLEIPESLKHVKFFHEIGPEWAKIVWERGDMAEKYLSQLISY
jgi:hypothetical protein